MKILFLITFLIMPLPTLPAAGPAYGPLIDAEDVDTLSLDNAIAVMLIRRTDTTFSKRFHVTHVACTGCLGIGPDNIAIFHPIPPSWNHFVEHEISDLAQIALPSRKKDYTAAIAKELKKNTSRYAALIVPFKGECTLQYTHSKDRDALCAQIQDRLCQLIITHDNPVTFSRDLHLPFIDIESKSTIPSIAHKKLPHIPLDEETIAACSASIAEKDTELLVLTAQYYARKCRPLKRPLEIDIETNNQWVDFICRHTARIKELVLTHLRTAHPELRECSLKNWEPPLRP